MYFIYSYNTNRVHTDLKGHSHIKVVPFQWEACSVMYLSTVRDTQASFGSRINHLPVGFLKAKSLQQDPINMARTSLIHVDSTLGESSKVFTG